MYCGNWYGFWGYPYYFGGLLGILLHLTILALIVWIVLTVIKSLTSYRQETSKNGGGR